MIQLVPQAFSQSVEVVSLVRQVMEEIGEFVKLILQERIHTTGGMLAVPVSQKQEWAIEVVTCVPQVQVAD